MYIYVHIYVCASMKAIVPPWHASRWLEVRRSLEHDDESISARLCCLNNSQRLAYIIFFFFLFKNVHDSRIASKVGEKKPPFNLLETMDSTCNIKQSLYVHHSLRCFLLYRMIPKKRGKEKRAQTVPGISRYAVPTMIYYFQLLRITVTVRFSNREFDFCLWWVSVEIVLMGFGGQLCPKEFISYCIVTER